MSSNFRTAYCGVPKAQRALSVGQFSGRHLQDQMGKGRAPITEELRFDERHALPLASLLADVEVNILAKPELCVCCGRGIAERRISPFQ